MKKKRIQITYLQKKKIVTKTVQGYSHKLGGIGEFYQAINKFFFLEW